jgi:hypothetical protein
VEEETLGQDCEAEVPYRVSLASRGVWCVVSVRVRDMALVWTYCSGVDIPRPLF